MYYFDPDLGRRRRALLRDKLTGTLNDLDDALEMTLRDGRNRVQGLLSETLSLLPGPRIADERLEGRVRSVLGHRVSQPRKVDVSVHDGSVVLSGSVHPAEVQHLLLAVRLIRGVRRVENRLEPHAEPGHRPASMIQARWSPATRLTAGAVGTWLMARCTRNPTLVNMALGTLGFGMFTRAITNVPVMESAQVGAERIKELAATGERAQEQPQPAEAVSTGL
jgi:hypothetical protein